MSASACRAGGEADARCRARRKESEYEESIEAYKETPLFSFVRKWRRRRAVRRRKKALRRANASLRSHYYVRVLNKDPGGGRRLY